MKASTCGMNGKWAAYIDREHIVGLSFKEREALIEWLKRPSGSHCTPRATFEAVEGGGIFIRTKPYSYQPNRIHINQTNRMRRERS